MSTWFILYLIFLAVFAGAALNFMLFIILFDVFEESIKKVSKKFDKYIYEKYNKETDSKIYFQVILYIFTPIISIVLFIYNILYGFSWVFDISMKFLGFLYNLVKFSVSQAMPEKKVIKEKQQSYTPEVKTVYDDLVHKYRQ